MSLEEDQAFQHGAYSRRRGVSKTQSCKPYASGPAGPSDAWKACREGWDAMDTYLLMGEIDKRVTDEES